MLLFSGRDEGVEQGAATLHHAVAGVSKRSSTLLIVCCLGEAFIFQGCSEAAFEVLIIVGHVVVGSA